MQIAQSRRHFLASASLAAAAGVVGGRSLLADEPPPETAVIRLMGDSSICQAPEYIVDDLLHAEGFTEIRYLYLSESVWATQAHGRPRHLLSASVDNARRQRRDRLRPFPPSVRDFSPGCRRAGNGVGRRPRRLLRGIRPRAHPVHQRSEGSHRQRPEVTLGLVPAARDHGGARRARSPKGYRMGGEFRRSAHGAVCRGESRRLHCISPRAAGAARPQHRSRHPQHHHGQPWSQYLCCIIEGNRDFVRANPVATKRFLRALFKGADLCAKAPETAARRLIEAGFAERYDYVLQTLAELPYGTWRDFDPEDSLRFYALQMHEVGFITSSPNELLAAGTDWRFLNELKRELKA